MQRRAPAREGDLGDHVLHRGDVGLWLAQQLQHRRHSASRPRSRRANRCAPPGSARSSAYWRWASPKRSSGSTREVDGAGNGEWIVTHAQDLSGEADALDEAAPLGGIRPGSGRPGARGRRVSSSPKRARRAPASGLSSDFSNAAALRATTSRGCGPAQKAVPLARREPEAQLAPSGHGGGETRFALRPTPRAAGSGPRPCAAGRCQRRAQARQRAAAQVAHGLCAAPVGARAPAVRRWPAPPLPPAGGRWSPRRASHSWPAGGEPAPRPGKSAKLFTLAGTAGPTPRPAASAPPAPPAAGRSRRGRAGARR